MHAYRERPIRDEIMRSLANQSQIGHCDQSGASIIPSNYSLLHRNSVVNDSSCRIHVLTLRTWKGSLKDNSIHYMTTICCNKHNYCYGAELGKNAGPLTLRMLAAWRGGQWIGVTMSTSSSIFSIIAWSWDCVTGFRKMPSSELPL